MRRLFETLNYGMRSLFTAFILLIVITVLFVGFVKFFMFLGEYSYFIVIGISFSIVMVGIYMSVKIVRDPTLSRKQKWDSYLVNTKLFFI